MGVSQRRTALTAAVKVKVVFLSWGMVVTWRKNRLRDYVLFLFSIEPDMWDEL